MKYKLLKQFDKDSIPVWDTFDMGDREYCTLDFDDSKISVAWLIKEWYIEPVEKKRYEDLKKWDRIYWIDSEWEIIQWSFHETFCRSEVFLTREEAEDEYKRREWAVRPDKFIPEIWKEYFYPTQNGIVDRWVNSWTAGDFMLINAGLAFKRYTHCEKAMKEHDLVRLFYTIR